MQGLTDNHQSIAWYIRQCLEPVSRQEGDKRAQATAMHQALARLTFKLPAFLYNAGYTSSIIPVSDIGIQQHDHIAEITVNNIGRFIFNMKENRLHTSTGKEEPGTASVTGPFNEALIKHNSYKQYLQKAADLTSGIDRDTGFSNIKPEEAINEVKEHWSKYKYLVQGTPGQHATNKGVYTMENDI